MIGRVSPSFTRAGRARELHIGVCMGMSAISSDMVFEADLPRIEIGTPYRGLMRIHLRPGFGTTDMANYLQRAQQIASAGPYAVLLTCEMRMPLVSPRHAAMQVAWIRDNYALIENNCAGVAVVLPNAFVRGAMRAVVSMKSTQVSSCIPVIITAKKPPKVMEIRVRIVRRFWRHRLRQAILRILSPLMITPPTDAAWLRPG